MTHNVLVVKLSELDTKENLTQSAIITYAHTYSSAKVGKILILPSQEVCYAYIMCFCGNKKLLTLSQYEKYVSRSIIIEYSKI